MIFPLSYALLAGLVLLLDLGFWGLALRYRRALWGGRLLGYLLWSAGLAAAVAMIAWAQVGMKPGYAFGFAALSVPVIGPALLWQSVAGRLWVLLAALIGAAGLALAPRPRTFATRVVLGMILLPIALSEQGTVTRAAAIERGEAQGLLVIEAPDLVRNLRLWLGHHPGTLPHGIACEGRRSFIWSYAQGGWIEVEAMPEVQQTCDKTAQ
ncbi:hypothetical protein C8J30_10820 [Rhodobacter viridis]|uniref:Uncharacterized protein n=1 Tax=Rhodobacter viridis TaxID=1054202 RepID=A0A318U0E7_9RHOB|nr:hypothetical protein [Rhodobacter viridis]PYF09448.1 hypothetical protein C8J30_10820 [Rhodobacter viridis]